MSKSKERPAPKVGQRWVVTGGTSTVRIESIDDDPLYPVNIRWENGAIGACELSMQAFDFLDSPFSFDANGSEVARHD